MRDCVDPTPPIPPTNLGDECTYKLAIQNRRDDGEATRKPALKASHAYLLATGRVASVSIWLAHSSKKGLKRTAERTHGVPALHSAFLGLPLCLSHSLRSPKFLPTFHSRPLALFGSSW